MLFSYTDNVVYALITLNETTKYYMTVTIYHNPKCSKSRQTLALLKERGIKLKVIKYLQTPPDFATLDDMLIKLNLEPRQIMRRKETLYTELKLNNETLSTLEHSPRVLRCWTLWRGPRKVVPRSG